MASAGGGGPSWVIAHSTSGTLSVGVYVGGALISPGSFALAGATWYHVAMVRSGSTLYFFVNGALHSSTTAVGSSSIDDSPNQLGVGGLGAYTGGGTGGPSGDRWIGYLDDFRVTKGVARYTAPFTPPTAAFPNA